MPIKAEAATSLEGQSCVEKLAHLFPHASPVRIAVCVSTVAAEPRQLQEQTVVEFGTAREVLFSSALPLEFEDRVRLQKFKRLVRCPCYRSRRLATTEAGRLWPHGS